MNNRVLVISFLTLIWMSISSCKNRSNEKINIQIVSSIETKLGLDSGTSDDLQTRLTRIDNSINKNPDQFLIYLPNWYEGQVGEDYEAYIVPNWNYLSVQSTAFVVLDDTVNCKVEQDDMGRYILQFSNLIEGIHKVEGGVVSYQNDTLLFKEKFLIK